MKFLLALVFLTFSAHSAHAQVDVSTSELTMQTEDIDTSSKNNRDPLGWWPFLSLNMGQMDFDGENSGDGYNLQVKGLLSYYEFGRNFNFEAGAGLQNSDAGNSSTTSGVLEASTRYRWLTRWEAGPLINIFVGNGNSYGSSNSDLTSFLGANLLYSVPLNNGDLVRAGGRWVTDVGIPGEVVNIFMFELHYGLGLGQTASPRVESPAPRSDHLARLAFENSEWEGPQLAYSTLQVEPNTTDRNRVAQLGRSLFEDNDLVTSIRVIGHADERGSTYSNQLLSKARANSVANALIFAGYPKDRIEIVPMGESQPVATGKAPSALEKNRRVELEFKGVRDLAKLRQLLDEAGIE